MLGYAARGSYVTASRGGLEVYVWAGIALLAECQLINLIKKQSHGSESGKCM